MSTQSEMNIYLTEALIIQILLRLPTASCLARCRCVSRSWRSLLSDPEFTRKFLFFHRGTNRRRILIKRLCYDRSVYSLHHYDTLRHHIAADEGEDLPSVPYKVRWPNGTSQLSVVGHANGIFCLADGNSDGASDIILWNPETPSEIRVLPVSPFAHRSGFAVWGQLEQIGFGFDAATNDYKVVRTVQFTPNNNGTDYDDGGGNYADDQDDDDGGNYADDQDDDDGGGNYSDEQDDDEEEVELSEVFSVEDDDGGDNYFEEVELREVFSVKHGSWRKLEGGMTHGLINSIPECHEGRFYWWDQGIVDGDGNRDGCKSRFVSFDMNSEVFEEKEVVHPRGMSEDFLIRSVSMVKGSVVAMFSDMETVDTPNSLEIWALVLEVEGEEAWTKLYTVASTQLMSCMHPVEMWRDGKCFMQRYEDGELVVFDPEIGSVVSMEVKLQGEWQHFQVVPYAPSRVSILELA